MKSTWIYLLLIVTALAKSEESLSVDQESEGSEKKSIPNHRDEYADEEDSSDKELFILPPIIAIDVGSLENNTSPQEKSKRTIEGSLGNGYLQNSLFDGKYKYFFPGSQTGNTVTIEESISPFEPQTIIETEKPVTEKSANGANHQLYPSKPQMNVVNQPVAQPWTAPFPRNQPIFGQRTKLRKYTPSDYSQRYTTTIKSNIAYTTVRPDFNNQNQNDFTTVNSVYSNQYSDYSTTPTYNSEYVAGLNPPGSSFETLTTPNPLSDDPSLFNIPRYTVENGIKYENKIVWKYPDGRIANPPATSYINSYSQYSGPQQTKINHQSTFQSSSNPSNSPNLRYPAENYRPTSGFKNTAYQDNKNTRYPIDQKQNIYSQKPAQFPMDQGTFSARPGGNSQSSAFDLSYQANYGFRQRDNVKGPNRFQENRLSVPKYSVNSPNPEYTFPPVTQAETTPTPNTFAQKTQLTPETLSKYSPQAQKYLTKVLNSQKNKQANGNTESFIEKNYESLLNYNPSISQYIKDPSSILHATPTFIQAGDSLVPVIILRLDGARPVTPQPTPNINLKALLQQYLTQYVGKAAGQNVNYNQDDQSKFSPIEDLTYLTQALKRFSPSAKNNNANSNHNRNLNIQSIANLPLEYETVQYNSQKTSYDTLTSTENQFSSDNPTRFKYPGLKPKLKPKVKSVQIIEDQPSSDYKEPSQE
ncbi:uncharacterized protein [Chelonus insularis]|uniref:uncharacterized protein n=1 Tax=Chelonus insularis TaxID=460826 RepID=UPI00158DF7CC|nr:uncharacterized protein LOC118074467 [Chelonus insularis]